MKTIYRIKKAVYFCLPISVLACNKGFAQTTNPSHELGFIPIAIEELNLSFPLVKKWKLSGQVDIQYETQGSYTNKNPFAYPQRFMIRPWVEYSGFKNLRLWAGWARLHKYEITETNNYETIEHRISVMGSLTQNLSKGSVFEQLRFETRFYDDQNDVHRVVPRVRARVGVNHFLAQHNPNSFFKTPNFSYYSEIILRFAPKDYAPDHFDTYKMMVYYSAGLTSKLHFLFGMIGQLQLHTSGTVFDLYYGPQLSLKWNFISKQRETFEDADGKSD